MRAAGRPGRGDGLTGRAAACAILAAALWISGNRWARRAAWRGLGSMAAGSMAASLADRRQARPTAAAASAAAFATGIALELPYLAVPRTRPRWAPAITPDRRGPIAARAGRGRARGDRRTVHAALVATAATAASRRDAAAARSASCTHRGGRRPAGEHPRGHGLS